MVLDIWNWSVSDHQRRLSTNQMIDCFPFSMTYFTLLIIFGLSIDWRVFPTTKIEHSTVEILQGSTILRFTCEQTSWTQKSLLEPSSIYNAIVLTYRIICRLKSVLYFELNQWRKLLNFDDINRFARRETKDCWSSFRLISI